MLVTLDLTNEKYIYNDNEHGEKGLLKADMGDQVDISEAIVDQLKNGIDCYYTLTEIKTDYGIRMRFGIDPEDFDLVPSETFDPEMVEQYMEYIILAHWKKRAITLQIPVSVDDVIYQLSWYGMYIDIDTESVVPLNENLLPGIHGEERFGTHPTKQEVNIMNKNFAYEFSYTRIWSDVGSDAVDLGKLVKTYD